MENNKDIKNVTEEKKELEAQKSEAPVYGVVTDCKNLYVRKRPKENAEPVQIIAGGTKVQVDQTMATEDFYKVFTASGAEGYCMRKYIQIQ